MQQLEVNTSTMESPSSQVIDGISLQEFLVILRRRRMVIAQAFVLITLVAVVWTVMTKPVYQASARLLVEAPSTRLDTVDTSNPFSEILALTQPQSVDTQVEVLQSPSLYQKLGQNLNANVGQSAVKGKVRTRKVDLKVKAVDDTNVIEVTGESTDPQLAADAPNTLLQLYIEQDVDQNQGEIKNAITFGKQQEMDARKKLDDAEAKLEQFKRQNRVADLTTDRAQQVTQAAGLTSDLQKAKTDLASLRSQIAETQRELAGEPTRIVANSDSTNTVLAATRDKIADLRQQRASLTQDEGFTDKAPQIQAIDAQIAVLQKRLATEPGLTKTVAVTPNARRVDLHAKLQDLLAQQAALETSVTTTSRQLDQIQGGIGHYAGWEVTLENLTRQHDEAAALETMLSSKLADLTLREKAHHATARINEVAQLPGAPIRPKKSLNIILGALFGLFIGICLAMLQEFLDDRINTVEDASRVLGLPSLGYVPSLSADDARLLPQMNGMDPAAESYRLLRTNIQFAGIDSPIKTLLVTSSGPGEGKTTTAANLAFAMAMDGKRVILVDTDLRRPSLHKLLSLPTVPGITDVLLGRSTLEHALLDNEHLPNLSTLSAGTTPPNPGELVNSKAFHSLVAELSGQSDIVIFDSPPVLVAADAAIMAAQMDGTVIVVETGETKKAPARQALAMLNKGRANILGVAYNKMRALDGSGYYYQYQYGTPLTGKDAAAAAKRLTAPVEEEL